MKILGGKCWGCEETHKVVFSMGELIIKVMKFQPDEVSMRFSVCDILIYVQAPE